MTNWSRKVARYMVETGQPAPSAGELAAAMFDADPVMGPAYRAARDWLDLKIDDRGHVLIPAAKLRMLFGEDEPALAAVARDPRLRGVLNLTNRSHGHDSLVAIAAYARLAFEAGRAVGRPNRARGRN